MDSPVCQGDVCAAPLRDAYKKTVRPHHIIALFLPPTIKMLEGGTPPWILPSAEGTTLPLHLDDAHVDTVRPHQIIRAAAIRIKLRLMHLHRQ